MTARVAGASISWGVCELPGWGYQPPAGRVPGQMRELGLTATEFGPDGFLPAGPAGRAAYQGWYVRKQDRALTGEEAGAAALAGVRASLRYLASLRP